jgi:hypothetical protein
LNKHTSADFDWWRKAVDGSPGTALPGKTVAVRGEA